ncbi:hypothetical protein DQP57_04825 [Mycobacterium colombiense]|uniref:Uncharacterized protein n=1 Tax=Mycobacterium colombiense TaxID=339268 RepID=A0A329M5G9_9MYCO|nr:hypothetical protein DQP57_04825 [Mycobacterium colombiense]
MAVRIIGRDPHSSLEFRATMYTGCVSSARAGSVHMRSDSDRLLSGHFQLDDDDVSIALLMISAISPISFWSPTTVDGAETRPGGRARLAPRGRASFVGTSGERDEIEAALTTIDQPPRALHRRAIAVFG